MLLEEADEGDCVVSARRECVGEHDGHILRTS